MAAALLWKAGHSKDMTEMWNSCDASFNLMREKKKRALCCNTPVMPDISFIWKCAKVHDIKKSPSSQGTDAGAVLRQRSRWFLASWEF